MAPIFFIYIKHTTFAVVTQQLQRSDFHFQSPHFTMVKKIFSATFALALLLAQVAHGLPQASDTSQPNQLTPRLATIDPVFDHAGVSMLSVTCRDTSVLAKWRVLGDVPSFPFIGGAFDITGDNSNNCGSCWAITNPRTGVSIQMTAIDRTFFVGDFNLGVDTIGNLTKGDRSVSEIKLVATKLSTTPCGM